MFRQIVVGAEDLSSIILSSLRTMNRTVSPFLIVSDAGENRMPSLMLIRIVRVALFGSPARPKELCSEVGYDLK
jgi:hypothetical protein